MVTNQMIIWRVYMCTDEFNILNNTLSKMDVTYFEECENLLLILSIHITLFKHQEVWKKSIAGSDVPGIQEEGILSVDVPWSTSQLCSCPIFTATSARPHCAFCKCFAVDLWWLMEPDTQIPCVLKKPL